jgi:hypothetical protein
MNGLNIQQTQVSLYRNKTDAEPVPVDLFTVLTTHKYKERIVALRQMMGDKQDETKKQLPCFTIGGVYSGGHSASNRVQSTNLIGIDLDFKDNDQVAGFNNLKAACKVVPYIAYCGLSCRGKGYLIVMPLAHPDRFLQHFKALQKEFARFGLTIDDKCSNPNRLRFVSYDPAPYVNMNAMPFSLIHEEKRVLPTAFKHTAYRAVGNSIQKNVEAIINEVSSCNIDLTTGYNNWLATGFAFSSEFGEAGRDYFHTVSQMSRQYERSKTDTQYTNCLRARKSGITIKTFFHICKQAGIVLPTSELTQKPTTLCNIVPEPKAELSTTCEAQRNTIEQQPDQLFPVIEETAFPIEAKGFYGYVDEAGRLFIPTPPLYKTFTLYKDGIRAYNNRSELPTIVNEKPNETRIHLIEIYKLIIN